MQSATNGCIRLGYLQHTPLNANPFSILYKRGMLHPPDYAFFLILNFKGSLGAHILSPCEFGPIDHVSQVRVMESGDCVKAGYLVPMLNPLVVWPVLNRA